MQTGPHIKKASNDDVKHLAWLSSLVVRKLEVLDSYLAGHTNMNQRRNFLQDLALMKTSLAQAASNSVKKEDK